MIALLAVIALGIDVDEARQRAAEASVAVEQARAAADIARADARVVLGGSLPAVAAFATAGTGAGRTASGFERPIGAQLAVGVTGRWSLVDPGAWAAASAARRSAAGREALLDWAVVTARRDATGAFAAAVAAVDVAAARDRAWRDAEEGLAAVQSVVAAGLRPTSDLARSEAAAATARAQLETARADVIATCAALQNLMAIPVDGRCDLTPSPWAAPTATADGEHPALTAAREASGAARVARRAAVLDLLPTVDATGTAAEYVIPGGTSGPGWSAGVTIDAPVWTGGIGRARIDAAAAALDRADAELAEQERALAAATLGAEARYAAALAGLEARTAAARAAERAHTEIDARYTEGLVGAVEWLDARNERDAAAVALALAAGDLGTALAEVEAARGVR